MTRPTGLPQLGAPEIDGEHALQDRLVAEFADATRSGAGADRCAEIVEHLLACTEAHFLAEQLLMRLHAFPGYQEHVQQHDALVSQLRALRGDLASGTRKPGAEMAAWLHEWLAVHVSTLDAVFVEYLREHGKDSAPTV